MLLYLLFFHFSTIQLSSSEVFRTINEDDLLIANYCMNNKHPFRPSTFSCEDSHQHHTLSQLSTISQMLKNLDPQYIPSSTLYPTFPTISSGIFGLHSTYPLSINYLAKYAAFNTMIGADVGCWRPFTSDQSQFLVMGSSVPYTFQKLVTAGSGNLNMWVTSFNIRKTLDYSYWELVGGVYTSNTDDNSLFELVFEPFVARAIYITPLSWNVGIAMRVEVYVSKHDLQAQILKGRLFDTINYGFHVVLSNIMNDYRGFDFMRIYNPAPSGYVSFLCLDNGEYVIVSSGHLMKWDKIQLINSEGAYDKVEYLKIAYTLDAVDWIDYEAGASILPNNGQNYNYYLIDVYAISIKVKFYTSNSNCCLKFEAYASEA